MHWWEAHHPTPSLQTETSIVLPDKVFTDIGRGTYPVVTIRGRWAGDGLVTRITQFKSYA
jgi:hypothetical protein